MQLLATLINAHYNDYANEQFDSIIATKKHKEKMSHVKSVVDPIL